VAVRDASGKPAFFGYCCSCGKKCFSGQELVAGERDCEIRHKACLTPRRRDEIAKHANEERWG